MQVLVVFSSRRPSLRELGRPLAALLSATVVRICNLVGVSCRWLYQSHGRDFAVLMFFLVLGRFPWAPGLLSYLSGSISWSAFFMFSPTGLVTSAAGSGYVSCSHLLRYS